MIKGFSKFALIVYPMYDDYIEKGPGYKKHMQEATEKLKRYLSMCEITYDCYATDDVARELSVVPDRWVITLNRGDMFFASRNCDGMDMDFVQQITYDDVYEKSAVRFPYDKGISTERRFEIMLKRDNFSRRMIANKYKLIFQFRQPKSDNMRYTRKRDSGVLFTDVDNTTFNVRVWMGDMQLGTVEIFGVNNAFMPLYEWEV